MGRAISFAIIDGFALCLHLRRLPLSLCSHRTSFHLQCLAAEYRATDEAPTFDCRLKYAVSQMRRLFVSQMGSRPGRRSCSAPFLDSTICSVIFIIYFCCLLSVAVNSC